jgi:dipeptidyl aminopeptidase/acylaminoacyl peptidase
MTERFTYGSDPLNYVDLHRGAGVTRGTVILIHGGFWRWNADYFNGPTPAAELLASQGWNVWQIEYRSVGSGGGWPTTLEDVAAAIDALATAPDIQLGRVITVGHSAGGHLAVWALSHTGPVALSGAVSLAGVLDLRLAEREGIGSDAAVNFLGGTSATHPERYDSASPSEHPVTDLPVRIIHGTGDYVVPMSQSSSYVVAAKKAGQDVQLKRVNGDHDVVIDPSSDAWVAVVDAITDLTAGR